MMPTSEERREVARKFRKEADNGAPFVTASIVGLSDLSYGDWKAGRNDAECWNWLADLIEPEPERTCEILHDDNLSEQYGGPMARCSYCGAALPEEFIGPYYYCPCCGSKNKVVE